MKRVMILCLGSAFVLLLLRALGARVLFSAAPDQAPSTAAAVADSSGRIIVVTSTADSGPGTLRQALLDAQSGDTITFDAAIFPPATPATIALTSGLPGIIQGNLTINASNAGVILDGGGISESWPIGLDIVSSGNTVQGLQIVNYPGSGIVLRGGAQNNMVGGDRSIGAGLLGQGNLTSANYVGIDIQDDGTSGNSIRGNLIGTDLSGTTAWGNHETGVFVANGAGHNKIGPDNIIAYCKEGIQIAGSNSVGNTVTKNSIHDNDTSGIWLHNGGNTGLAAPHIIDFDLGGGTVGGTACTDCAVEIFSDNSAEGGVYEGQATADRYGFFTLNKGVALTGPHLTATATDADGNTSRFSPPTSGTHKSTLIQHCPEPFHPYGRD